MSERSGIFSGDDPFGIARRWLEDARALEPADPDAASLATVDSDGLPNVRIVLMRGIEDDGFLFYTNYESAKGKEITETGVGAFVLHWKSLQRQIRVRGRIEKASSEQSDEYFASRPVQSRIGAWASKQSQPLSSRAALMADVARLTLKMGPLPKRPPHWGGFKITPSEMEFWAAGDFRLHDRFKWLRTEDESDWTVTRLNP